MSILPWEARPKGQAAVAVERIGQSLPRIATQRTVMRGPYIEDFDIYADIVTSDRGRFVSAQRTREGAWDDFLQLTASWILRGAGLWTVEDQHDKQVLGFVLLGHETGDPEPELSFFFTAEAEGRGLAFEAATSARNNAYNALSWDSLVSYIEPGNDRAIRLAERLGAFHDPKGDHDGTLCYRYPRPEIPDFG
ncbi:MAG: GNAT family N-acetyltransferase [Limimaricola sp.]|uniref:GNAT family N-acetyltransferase n=1 Tax=Limimaricola sp. TaxID=2211665 RepID=UPI001E18D881|nr:GNAT family N-acetyltransferase [Limimaricola sp.]MBI1417587.1 GNAT family N-acetyltransferase [Limimaricola sp.]